MLRWAVYQVLIEPTLRDLFVEGALQHLEDVSTQSNKTLCSLLLNVKHSVVV